MDTESQTPRSLREMEEEAIEEAREYARKRLQEKLQKEADRQGGVFPPKRKKSASSARQADGTAHRRGVG